MKKNIIVILLVGIIVALLFFIFKKGGGPIVVMNMKDDGFEPVNITIKQGETMEFRNDGKNEHWPASNIHPTHEIYTEFDPKRPIAPDASWSFTFGEAGKWRYHDHLYPEIGGLISVE